MLAPIPALRSAMSALRRKPLADLEVSFFGPQGRESCFEGEGQLRRPTFGSRSLRATRLLRRRVLEHLGQPQLALAT